MGEKQELRDRVEELTILNELAAREIIRVSKELDSCERKNEQLKGQLTLQQLNHNEQVAELAVAAKRSQKAYEALTSERGGEPSKLGELLDEAVESSVRVRLETLDEIARLLFKRTIGDHHDTIVERLDQVLRERDEAVNRASELRSTYSQLTATVQAAFGFMKPDDAHEDIPVQSMAETISDYFEDEAIIGSLRQYTELVTLVGAVHDRVVGDNRVNLTPSEQLVEIGDYAAKTKRMLRDARATISRQGGQIERMTADQRRFIELAKEVDA